MKTPEQIANEYREGSGDGDERYSIAFSAAQDAQDDMKRAIYDTRPARSAGTIATECAAAYGIDLNKPAFRSVREALMTAIREAQRDLEARLTAAYNEGVQDGIDACGAVAK